MFDWSGCPAGFFDLYMEVGEVKDASVKAEDCVFIELWIASTFHRDCIRQECKNPARRPIYGVLKEIREISQNKPVCLILLCDDGREDTVLWEQAITLLADQLKKENRLKHILVYAGGTMEIPGQLWDAVDGVVYGQSNFYPGQTPSKIVGKTPALPHLLELYLQHKA